MQKREPGIFYGVNAVDFLKIGLAFLFSLAGFYLMWRMTFGPPLFEPSAIQGQIRKMQTNQQPAGRQQPAAQQPAAQPPEDRSTPGEVSVGIAPRNPNPNH